MITDAKFRLTSMAVVALLAFSPANAQEATTEQPATDAPAEQPAEGTASATEAAPADGGLGQTYSKDVSGDWQILCVRTQLEADPCRMHQLLKDQTDNAVATIEIVNLPAQQQVAAGVTIVTPLETLLSEQVTMSVDGGAGEKLPFEFCTPRGCVVRFAVGGADLDRFRRGNTATMTIVPAAARDQTVDLNVSLKGFTDGFKQVTELNLLTEEALKKAAAAQGQTGN